MSLDLVCFSRLIFAKVAFILLFVSTLVIISLEARLFGVGQSVFGLLSGNIYPSVFGLLSGTLTFIQMFSDFFYVELFIRSYHFFIHFPPYSGS